MNKKLILLLIVSALIITGCTNTDVTSEEAPVPTTAPEEAPAENSSETSGSNFSVVDVTDIDFDSIVPNSTGIALVDFWADWCGPCRALGPILEEVCEEQNAVLYKVDVDQSPELSSRFGINAFPMVQLYKDGQLVDSFVGALSKEQVEQYVAKYQ